MVISRYVVPVYGIEVDGALKVAFKKIDSLSKEYGFRNITFLLRAKSDFKDSALDLFLRRNPAYEYFTFQYEGDRTFHANKNYEIIVSCLPTKRSLGLLDNVYNANIILVVAERKNVENWIEKWRPEIVDSFFTEEELKNSLYS